MRRGARGVLDVTKTDRIPEGAGLTDSAGSPPPTLTVVVANFNHGRFLPQCLTAILAQTRAPDEVLVIDDASTDDSVAVVSAFASRLPAFRLIRHERNQGVVAVMNEGLREAQGTYVLFAAADDWIEPGLVEASLHMLARFPGAGLCSALTRLATENGTVTGAFRTPVPSWTPAYLSPAEVSSRLTADDGWFNGNTTLINRAAALEAGGYRPELRSFTDGFLNATLALRHGACFIPRLLAVWRRMGSGYAAALVADPTAMVQTFEAARAVMCAPGERLFAPEVVDRWAARWRFTAARSVLSSPADDRRRRLAAVLPDDLGWTAPPLDRLARIPYAGPACATGLLFLLLRMRDLGPVLRRRLGWVLRRRRLEDPRL